MGVPSAGRNYAAIQEQCARLAYSNISFTLSRGDKKLLSNQTLLDDTMFERGADGTFFTKRARLSHKFFVQLRDHPVPLQNAAIRQLSNNSLGLDVYAWLSYRLHHLDKPTPANWALLRQQFGVGYSRFRDFKRRFEDALELALAVYPEAKVDIWDNGTIMLHPSPPPVPKVSLPRFKAG